MPHPACPKGRKERAPTARQDTHSKAEVREDKARAKFVSKNRELLTADDMASGGPPPPQGPYFYQENGKNVFFPPKSNGQWDNELPTLQANDERLREQRDTSAPTTLW